MITAFINQCDGEVLAPKQQRRNARVAERSVAPNVDQHVPYSDMEAGPADGSSSKGKHRIV